MNSELNKCNINNPSNLSHHTESKTKQIIGDNKLNANMSHISIYTISILKTMEK